MRKGYPEEKKTEVRRLREQGFSYAQIADRASVSINTVIKWLKGTGPMPRAIKAPKPPAVVKAPATKKNTSNAASCCRVPSAAQLKKLEVLKEKLLKLAGKIVQAAEKINN